LDIYTYPPGGMAASGSPLAVGLCVPQDDGVPVTKKSARTCAIHPNLFELYTIPSVFHPFFTV
jgi:hypothetical protein